MNITAVPGDDGHGYLLDCDLCGPLGTVERATLHHTVEMHLNYHGIVTPMTYVCTCGYDYTKVTGHNGDRADCTICDWSADGMFADHLGHHHYLDTRHRWQITMGDKRV